MRLPARMFVFKVIALHGGVFLALLAVVGATVYLTYQNAQAEADTQAGQRQLLLAKQAARGITNYFQSIVETVQLGQRLVNELERSESIDDMVPTTAPADQRGQRRPDLSSTRPRVGRNVPTPARQRLIQPFVDRTWQQLEKRTSHLITVDLLTQKLGPSQPDNAVPAAEKIIAACADELKTKEGKPPAVQITGRYDIDGIDFIVICLRPTQEDDKAMLAVVPIDMLVQLLADEGKANTATVTSMLADDQMRVIHSTDKPLLGTSLLNDAANPQIREFADQFQKSRLGDWKKIELPVKPQAATDPSASPNSGRTIVAFAPITLPGGSSWCVITGSDLGAVRSVVDQMFSGALLWVPAIVIGSSTLLLSTAWSVIQFQQKYERARAKLLVSELEHARKIQMSWLPKKSPELSTAGIEVHAVNQPASHVSGDFYNWFKLPDGRSVIVIGDVTGHGLAGAFLMSTTQMLVRSFMMKLADPAETVRQVNRELASQQYNGQFVTLMVLVLDVKTGAAQIVSAGHPPPLLCSGGKVSPLSIQSSLVLGVEAEELYETQSVLLPVPSSLLMFTDGVFECRNTLGKRYSMEQLVTDLDAQCADSAEGFLRTMLQAVDRFRGDQPLDDDLTAVALHIEEPAAAEEAPTPAPARAVG